MALIELDPRVFGPVSLTPQDGSATVFAARDVVPVLGGGDADIAGFRHSHNTYESNLAKTGGNNGFRFMTPAKAALDAFGLAGKKVSAGLWSLATFADMALVGGANDITYALAGHGFARVTGLSVSQGALLLAEVEVTALVNDDDGTPPMTRSTGQTLPTLAAEPELHTMGPISVLGDVIAGFAGWSIDPGITFASPPNDGCTYPTTGIVEAGPVSASAQHRSLDALVAQLGVAGSALSADVVLYARHINATSKAVEQANALSFTIASGYAMATEGSGERTAEGNLYIRGLGGTSHPITYSASATAPAVASAA